ncbi:hypothetical protein F4821DRAFT_221672 [Hypoxylon rubiginosum]|uniref:Uncharacterized protein n=1 Tax=Hypoxylon rubiginosum TaxID=110542 RepID=A0ACC0DN33_9PEZI|nr:hypothetical protein F4821DRAFT_221672 [Hypoxylon rubiginosum]
MADEVRQTPVPLPTYGQPIEEASTTATTAPAIMTVEQSSAAAATPDTTMSNTAPTAGVAGVPAPTTEQAHSPAAAAIATSTSNAPSPAAAAAAPARTGTPLRNVNGQDNNSSRAASQHPDSGFTMPAEAPPHGAPVRQYLNSTVTGPLLDGMKMIAKDRPKDPVRALGEFLIQRSKELEASSSA